MKSRYQAWAGVLIALVGGLIAYSALHVSTKGAAVSEGTQTAASAGTGNPSPAATGGGPAAAPIAVLTAVAQNKDVPMTRRYVGWVEPIVSVAIVTQIDGVIVEQPATEGQSVKTGDTLFRLDDRALQATIAKDQAAIAKDQATLDQLNADLARLESLVKAKDPTITTQQVEQLGTLANAAAGSVGIDKAQLQVDQVQLSYATVTAPVTGRVGVINYAVGARVHTSDQTPVLTLTQMAPVRVAFSVPESDLDAFRGALAAKVGPTTRALDPVSGKVLSQGVASFVDSIVNTASGTVMIKAEFANADGALWPGQYVNVEVDIGVRSQATVVPLTAIQLNRQNSFVFLVNGNGTVSRQPVEVAASIGDVAVIGAGVKPGDHVVVEGQLRLTDGASIKETLASADGNAPVTE